MIFAAGADEILKRFLAFKAKVVISAEGFLWPDKTLLVKTKILLMPICLSCIFFPILSISLLSFF